MTKAFAVALSSLLLPAAVCAQADFVIQARGAGFSDATTVAAQGGNTATRLGEQRLAAIRYAVELWGKKLDSKVPVTLDVAFEALGCTANSAVLASAGAVSLFTNIATNGADPTLYYPSALANRLAGKDLAPDEPDVVVRVNTSVDEECRSTFGGFYYGFDGQRGARVDLVQVVVHELAHGLGFSSWVDLESGQTEQGGLDVFSAHIWDARSQKTWRELSAVERRSSARAVRGLAFQGARTLRAARELLGKGSPSLALEPAPLGYLGAVGDSGSSYASVEGPLRLAGSFEGCGEGGSLSGAIVLVRPTCTAADLEARLLAQGALGALVVLPASYAQPAVSLAHQGLKVPRLHVSSGDAALMRSALSSGTLRARMTWDDKRLVGADPDGRPLLFASEPVDEGSSVSHFEPLARPDLLMEPFMGSAQPHALDLTWPVLVDLGWGPFCGNGRVDEGEECDEGSANSDSEPDACRALCTRARCGDRVVDHGESCDNGAANSDVAANACRTHCSLARCGDGVLDVNEQCDQGSSNSDALPDACRLDCRNARCGDGVVDREEACDGSQGCSERCTLPPAPQPAEEEGEDDQDGPADEETWVDPWDAPRGRDREQSKGRSSGCAITGSQTSAQPICSILLGFAFASLGQRTLRRRARRSP